jgi:membrane protease YdiL (CAAX protease family)
MLLAGLPIVIGGGSLAKLISVHPGLVLLALFVGYNAAWIGIFQLATEFRVYWSWRKLHHLLWGALAGLVLSLGPLLMLAATGQGIPAHPANPLKLLELLTTLLIVGWEELWFRGIPMNYMAKHLSPLTACVFASSLFVLMHALNPSIVLWRSAPGLFLGGMLLARGGADSARRSALR